MSNKDNKKEQNAKRVPGENVSKYFVQHIERWLKKEMEADPLFARTVEEKRAEKTVKGAVNYVLSVAKQTRQVGWDDEEVYGLIRHYFDEDDIKDPGEQNPSKVIISGHVDLSAEEKEEAKRQAVEEYKKELERKAVEEESARQKEAMEKEKARLQALKERKEKELAMQGDLFGGL